MKSKYLQLALVKAESRFELTVDGHTAFIDYVEQDDVIKLIHTESPDELAGRGVASALIEKTLQYLEQEKFQLVPLCPLVFAYIKKYPEWKRIVSPLFLPKFDV